MLVMFVKCELVDTIHHFTLSNQWKRTDVE